LEEISVALRASEEKYRHIIESIPLGMHMYYLDEDNRLIFTGANQAADKILEIDHRQFINQTIEQAFPNLVGTEIPEQYRQVAATGQMWQTDQMVYTAGWISRAFMVHAFQTSPRRMVAAWISPSASGNSCKLRRWKPSGG
jgi:PAS domain-containing protein